MSDDTKNHTLRLLQEIRENIRKGFSEASAEREDMREQLDTIQGAVAGLSYFQASERGEVGAEIEALKTRMQLIEDKLGLAGTPAE